MATPQVERLISDPFLGPNSRDAYRVVVEGRLDGNNFLPAEGRSSSIVNLYKIINEQDYNKIRQRDGENFVETGLSGNGKKEFYALSAVLNENKLATNGTTPPEIKQNPSKWGKIIKEQATAAVDKYKKYVNKTNLKPGTATVAETTGDAKSQATPIVGTEKIERPPNELILQYPSDMKDEQDRIKFSVWTNRTKDIDKYTNVKIGPNIEPNISLLANREKDSTNYTQVLLDKSPVVYLPITKISDSNTVDWNEDNLSILQSHLAQISLDFMRNKPGEAINQTSSLIEYATTNNEFGNMVRLDLAGKAVGVGGLLTRATGAVFNPNLELLFRGPQLRSFAFSFSMIAKSENEAEKIKKIILFFKKNMAVRTTDSNVFLKSPYVFKVEYVTATGNKTEPEGLHKSLNKIKLCALQSCSVDYTPMGSYMTFNDEDKTMFMYNLGLQFRELTPIYDTDYVDKQGNDIHPIGY